MNQLAWLQNPETMGWMTLAGRMLMAFALGVLVTRIYGLTHHDEAAPTDSFLTTLALLTILTAMSTQIIGDNVARAFSLVGALSIVRFRTSVRDTRDTAFVICAVVTGMAVGSGHVTVALTGLPVVALAAYVLRPRQSAAFQRTLADTPTTYSRDFQEAQR
jgi:hypothetical protein